MEKKPEHAPYPHQDGHRAKVGYPATDGETKQHESRHEKALERIQHMHDHPKPDGHKRER